MIIWEMTLVVRHGPENGAVAPAVRRLVDLFLLHIFGFRCDGRVNVKKRTDPVGASGVELIPLGA